jgi:hypothetical protein
VKWGTSSISRKREIQLLNFEEIDFHAAAPRTEAVKCNSSNTSFSTACQEYGLIPLQYLH